MDLLFNQVTEDLVLDGGDLLISNTTVTDLIQMLYLRLKTFKREWFMDVFYGIDYVNEVFGVNRTKSAVDAIMQTEIKKEVLVDDILFFDSRIENYSYSCEFQVKSIEEEAIVRFFILVTDQGIVLTTEDNLILKTQL
jgi:hypothetical protein